MPRPPISALLIDLSGTLHIGSKHTSGAQRAVKRLREARVPFRFCSNTSKEGRHELVARLTAMGFEVRGGSADGTDDGRRKEEEELWTSLGAVGEAVREMGLRRPYYLLSKSARAEIASAIPHHSTPTDETPHDAVIVGLAPNSFTYPELNTAFQILTGEHQSQRQLSIAPGNVPLLATHRAKYVRGADGALALGPGPFVAALEHASGAHARVLGKPSKAFFETVIASLPPAPSGGAARVAVIGDDVEADLGGGAVELGLWRVLVRTGKYRHGDECRAGLIPPDEIFDSFADFVDALLVPGGDQRSKL